MTSPAGLRSVDAIPDVLLSDAFAGVEQSVTGRRWVLRDVDERAALALSQALSISDIAARALTARGY